MAESTPELTPIAKEIYQILKEEFNGLAAESSLRFTWMLGSFERKTKKKFNRAIMELCETGVIFKRDGMVSSGQSIPKDSSNHAASKYRPSICCFI